MTGGAPRPNQWNRNKMIKFLMENPIPDGCTDRTWVEEEIKIMANHIESMRLETQKENCSGGNSWVNHEPFLCLYHTLNDDEVQEHLLKQFDSKDQYKLDARNSVVRDMDFYEIAAEKFNNIYWVPTSLRLPHLHSDFSELIELPMKYHPIDAKTVKKRLGIAWAQMVLVMSRWELLGNGAAMVDKTPEMELENMGYPDSTINLKDGDDRSNFIISEKPHVLYLWEICKQNGVLLVVCQQLSDKVKGLGESTNLTSYSSCSNEKKGNPWRFEMEKIMQVAKQSSKNMVSTLNFISNVDVNHRKYEIRMGYALQRRIELEKHIRDVKQSIIELNDRLFASEEKLSNAEKDNWREVCKRRCEELTSNRNLLLEEIKELKINSKKQRRKSMITTKIWIPMQKEPRKKTQQSLPVQESSISVSTTSTPGDQFIPSSIKARRSDKSTSGNYHIDDEYYTSSSSD